MSSAVEQVRGRATAAAGLDPLGELADALAAEGRAIEELRQALLRQRAGVAGDDAAAIEDSVHAMGRTLLTLEEARRRRTALAAHLTGGEPVPLAELERMLGQLPAPLVAAVAQVRRAAMMVAHEVAINQHVLRRALEAGDAFLQQLFSGGPDQGPGYSARERGPDASGAGVLLDRRA